MIGIRIIISPAKKMKIDNDSIVHRNLPKFIEESQILLNYLQLLSYEELKQLWKAGDKITQESLNILRHADLRNNLTPAILAYEGIQYQYMGPGVFTEAQLLYLEEHLRILSAFYGILRPFDGVVPYRLEMQARFENWDYKSLYEFWGHRIAQDLIKNTDLVLDLASKEYSRAIYKYLPKDIRKVECVFGEFVDGKIKEKATYAKMARGQMVRFMAENKIDNIELVKEFQGLGYSFKEEFSDERKFVFIKGEG